MKTKKGLEVGGCILIDVMFPYSYGRTNLIAQHVEVGLMVSRGSSVAD